MTDSALVPDFLGLVEAKLKTDERGRLVGSAPHFYLLRTPQGAICRFHADLADDVVLRLEAFSQRKRGRPAQWQSEYGDYLTALAAPNLRVAAMSAGPLYIFPDDIAPSCACTAVDEGNSYLLHNGLEEWLPDVAIGHPFFAAIEDGRAVAAWACAVRKLGAVPLYATTFDNISSQRVAQRLSLSPVASEFSVHCQLIP